MYLCTYIYIHTHIYVFIYIYIYTYTQTLLYIFIHIFVFKTLIRKQSPQSKTLYMSCVVAQGGLEVRVQN